MNNTGLAQQDSIAQGAIIETQKKDTGKIRRLRPISPPLKTDTIIAGDSTIAVKDSINKKLPVLFLNDSLFIHLKDSSTRTRFKPSGYVNFFKHPLIQYTKSPFFFINNQRIYNNIDFLFYLLSGVFAFIAFLKLLFPKYFQQIFLLFFQPSFRQKQTQDTLLQNNLASLLYNALFIVVGGTYIALLFIKNKWVDGHFWNIFAYATIILVLIYACKFLFLRLFGWLFNEPVLAGSYLFTVFLIHKVTAILLLPFLLLLAFAGTQIFEIAYISSIFIIVTLFFYRYIVAFGGLRNTLKINLLHFFLYFCAVEIIPLLIIYKLLANYLSITI